MLHALAAERLAGRPGEIHVRRFDALRPGIGWQKPENGVRTLERLLDDSGIAVRPLHHLHLFPDVCGKFGGITHDHTNRFMRGKKMLNKLRSDLARGRCHDDHDGSSSINCYVNSTTMRRSYRL